MKAVRPAHRNNFPTKRPRFRLASRGTHFFLPARIFYPVQFTFEGINSLFSTLIFGHSIATPEGEIGVRLPSGAAMVPGETYSMMEMVKRCLSLGSSLSFVFTGSRRSNAPTESNWEARKTADPAPALTPLAKASKPSSVPELPPVSSFCGTVVRDGGRFALREFDGTLFALDSTGRAWPFEGDDVSISGYFNPESKLLHICSIAAVDDMRAEAV